MSGSQDEWQSVDVARLSVAEAQGRLAIVRGRLQEPMSYDGREADAEEADVLQAKVLAEADGAELRAELDAWRQRAALAGDPEAQGVEQQWSSLVKVAFLDRADTSDLAAEAATLQRDAPTDPFRAQVERELREHRLVDQIADIALEELGRWDRLSGSTADGERLLDLAAAAEKLAGLDALEQFLRRLDKVDHEFHSDQLEHFRAAIGAPAATALAEKMAGRGLDDAAVRPLGSFFESFAEDVASGQVRDNLATIATVVGEKLMADLEELAELVVQSRVDPVAAAERFVGAVRELPGDVVDAVRSIPELPDRVAAAWKLFEQADESGQVRMMASILYEVEKGFLSDHAVGKLAGELLPGHGPDSPGKAASIVDEGHGDSPVPPATGQAGSKEVVVSGSKADPRTAGTGGIESVYSEIVKNRQVTIIEGTIKPAIERLDYEKGSPAASALGLAGYHRAHLWGPGFGDEAYAGIAYAPGDFNVTWQRAGIEDRIRELAEAAEARGATVHLRAEMRTHERDIGGGEALAEVKYTVDITTPDGKRGRAYEVSIHVDAPPSGRVHAPDIREGPLSPYGGDASWLDAFPLVSATIGLAGQIASGGQPQSDDGPGAEHQDAAKEGAEAEEGEAGHGVLLPPEDRPEPGHGVLLPPEDRPEPGHGVPLAGPAPVDLAAALPDGGGNAPGRPEPGDHGHGSSPVLPDRDDDADAGAAVVLPDRGGAGAQGDLDVLLPDGGVARQGADGGDAGREPAVPDGQDETGGDDAVVPPGPLDGGAL